jgi:NADH dehydrogenase
LEKDMPHVLIVGAGFAGLNAAKALANRRGIDVTVVDRENHHLFQPLLYQVATAALSPAEIAAPVRSILSKSRNVRVLLAEATRVDTVKMQVETSIGAIAYDYLILACGATHAYFGHDEWERIAPGLKTLAQATAIRGHILRAFELAESAVDPVVQRTQLTFVVVGGGPTGVELAGALGEMSRYTLARDFRRIDPRLARIILVEAGPRILPSFSARSAARAVRDLESLGVQVWVNARVTGISADNIRVGEENLSAGTVLWAAGVRAAPIAATLNVALDNAGRVPVSSELTVAPHRNVFVLGDLARCDDEAHNALPGTADVAQQQGRYVGQLIWREQQGHARTPFHYVDRGHLATIGRSRALYEARRARLSGRLAWWFWLLLHIYRLTGFRNRITVLVQWAWSYWTYGRGARLIVNPFDSGPPTAPADSPSRIAPATSGT